MVIPSAMRVQQILHPTDLSTVSRVAARAAADFVRHFGAELHVLSVVPSGFDLDAGRAALRDAVTALGAGLPVTEVVAAGIAAPTIVAYAERHGIDLIVMGTHGRTGFSHALLGSVAEAVIRRAPCPVLTISATAVTADEERAGHVAGAS